MPLAAHRPRCHSPITLNAPRSSTGWPHAVKAYPIAVTAADDVVVLDGILGPSADDLFETTLA